jgi:thymidylate synthase
MKVFSNFTEAYHDLLQDVYETPDFISAPRGQKIREKLGVSFKITNPLDRLPYVAKRDFSIAYYIAESLWYLSGSESTTWIANYSSFWKNISDDGITANSAYGSRIFKPHRRIASSISPNWTQWQYVIEELMADPDSRRAVIHIRSPQDSILAKKDVPCTLTLQFFLRDDKVQMVTSMRSSDIILGLAYDVPAFTLFQEILSLELSSRLNRKIGVGDYMHTSNSLHVYEKHFGMAESIISSPRKNSIEMPKIPDAKIPLNEIITFENICRNAETVEQVLDLLNNLSLNSYWRDWCLILASHKLSKYKDPDSSPRDLINFTDFKGYSFFSK